MSTKKLVAICWIIAATLGVTAAVSIALVPAVTAGPNKTNSSGC